MTLGLEVFVQLVMLAMSTEPWPMRLSPSSPPNAPTPLSAIASSISTDGVAVGRLVTISDWPTVAPMNLPPSTASPCPVSVGDWLVAPAWVFGGRLGVAVEVDGEGFPLAVALAVTALTDGLVQEFAEGVAEFRQVQAVLRALRAGDGGMDVAEIQVQVHGIRDLGRARASRRGFGP